MCVCLLCVCVCAFKVEKEKKTKETIICENICLFLKYTIFFSLLFNKEKKIENSLEFLDKFLINLLRPNFLPPTLPPPSFSLIIIIIL